MSLHLNPLDILLESQQPDRPPPDFRWGIVHGTAPDLSVRLDRDPTTVIGSCCSLSYPLEAGDRVMVMIYDGRAVVFGRGGGDRAASAVDDNPYPDAWRDWTPVLTATSWPSMGNSEVYGRYIHRADNTVEFVAQFRFGSTFNPGSGFYSMSIPVPARPEIEWPVQIHVTSVEVVQGHGDAIGGGKIENGETIGRLFFRRNSTTAASLDRVSGSSGWVAGNEIQVSGTYEAVPPSGKTALYLIPHQDDEILTTGAAILEDRKNGHDVKVAIMSRGEGSGTRTGPSLTGDLGYTPTEEEFSAARDREFVETVLRLGGTPIVPPWDDRFADGSGTSAHVKAWTLANFTDSNDLLLRATGPTDYHVDHRECGLAVESLAADGFGADHRLFLSAERRTSHRPPGVTMQAMGGSRSVTPAHAWPYLHVDISAGWWGIGGRSVGSSFDYLLDTNAISYWHPPR